MKQVIFKDNRIQEGFRVKIPKAIIDTLNLEKGEKIVIKFDSDKKLIFVEVKNG